MFLYRLIVIYSQLEEQFQVLLKMVNEILETYTKKQKKKKYIYYIRGQNVCATKKKNV